MSDVTLYANPLKRRCVFLSATPCRWMSARAWTKQRGLRHKRAVNTSKARGGAPAGFTGET
jgi:hypothetical protein